MSATGVPEPRERAGRFGVGAGGGAGGELGGYVGAARSSGARNSEARQGREHQRVDGSPAAENTTNICFEGIEGEAIVIALDLRGYAVSSGSACSSGAVEPSHVLLAMGLTPEEARSECAVFARA